MTEDEKLLERLLVMRFAQTPGTARDLAMDDFNWIKKYGAKPVADSGESGSLTVYKVALPATEPAEFTHNNAEGEHYVIRAGNWDEDEIKRMSES